MLGCKEKMADSRFDVTTFGEMMLRLSVPSGQRLETATNLNVYPAGAEANVTSLLARLERKTCWNGTLPNNPLGRLAANHLRMAGVDLKGILWREGGRLGTYYVEFGEPPRGIQVTYDRAHSNITTLKSDEINWDSLLDTRLLHLTGITPPLSDSCHEIMTQALAKAKQKKIPVSFDINYRQKLWSEPIAHDTLLLMIQNIEILFCSQIDAMRLFGCKGEMQEMAATMLEISHAKHVVVTFGEKGVLLWNGKEWIHEPSRATKIIDRLGAGDALAAGVIQGWLDGNLREGVKYGVTLAALALSQLGDMVITTKAELASLTNASSTITR
jgi:2-dehydro-3-deoxygluconokinase